MPMIIYGDEDSVSLDGERSNPRFKPAWNRELFGVILITAIIGLFVVISGIFVLLVFIVTVGGIFNIYCWHKLMIITLLNLLLMFHLCSLIVLSHVQNLQ